MADNAYQLYTTAYNEKGKPKPDFPVWIAKRMTDFLKMEGVIVGMQGPVELDVPLVRFAGQASGQ